MDFGATLHRKHSPNPAKMGPSQSPILIILILSLFSLHASSSDYTSLVFKGCADQNLNEIYKPTIRNLFATLTAQSSAAKFYKTSAGDGGTSAVNGLFQCRGDLSNDDCSRCVNRIPSMAKKLCGEAVAVRIQLNGCYLRYEVAGFRQASETELLYKVCRQTRASGAGFGDRLDSALGEIVKGLGNNGGFYAGEYQSVYVLGQCEGDLSGGECVNCVKNAVEKVKAECGSSISAQIYLQECYISYSYYPNGVPNSHESSSSSSGTGRNTQKTVALVLGGLVGVGLLMACLLFAKSALKKKTHTYKYGG